MTDPTKLSTTTTATPVTPTTTTVNQPITDKIVADGEDHNPVKAPETTTTTTTKK